jgi:hypothetical protein
MVSDFSYHCRQRSSQGTLYIYTHTGHANQVFGSPVHCDGFDTSPTRVGAVVVLRSDTAECCSSLVALLSPMHGWIENPVGFRENHKTSLDRFSVNWPVNLKILKKLK